MYVPESFHTYVLLSINCIEYVQFWYELDFDFLQVTVRKRKVLKVYRAG